ncbi:MAG TPA: class I SAM-dependent methyltransferase family protein [Candidatus Altiarchaeales archaeon]|nr:class I SAM-dependent methyltransferase family protein [Candidatus Altiarchaeales archaeon]
MKKKKPRSLKEVLEGKLSKEELEILPRAFDIIGDIATIEIPEKLEGKKRLIGNALIETFKNIKVVTNKTGKIDTEFRIRKLEIIAGENRTETIHREYGCSYKLDVESTYFSPRLGTERFRVASQVKENERVLVMFAGVGPYAVLIAKTKKPRSVYAIELNPKAFEYMLGNIKLNGVNVKAFGGDVREITPRIGKFDRIVMPLPKGAEDFLDTALPALNKNGIIHFYDFSGSEIDSVKKVRRICNKLCYRIEILNSIECGSYSPRLNRICIDFRVIED